MIDLHCHTVMSDGNLSVSELLQTARDLGLKKIAITDHDTMRGARYASAMEKEFGIEVLKGVEISSLDKDTGRKLHLLLYEPEETKELKALLNETRQKREIAGLKMLDKLRQKYPVTAEEVLKRAAESESIYKRHLMLPLMDMGHADEIYGELFHSLFDKGAPCHEPILYPDYREIMPILKATGGVLSLAHPTTYRSMDTLKRMLEAGMLDGIELHHPRNSEKDKKEIKSLIEKHGILCTGGTDFHGDTSPRTVPLGSVGVNEAEFQKIRALLKERNRI